MDVINNNADNFSPELVVICANSGIMVNDNGNTDIYTGLLTKELVVNANLNKSSIPSASYNRLVGGNNAGSVPHDNTEPNNNDESINSKLNKLVK